MKKSSFKKLLSVCLIMTFIIASFAGCNNSDNTNSTEDTSNTGESADADKPDTWIADRTIVVQAYVDDIGYNLPADINNTEVMKELKKRTGISLEIQYTPGDSDSSVMASHLASGSIPDVILSYLDNSTRPEFPILLKAAKEGMFADVSSYLGDTKVFSRYLEDGYLPKDTENNITFRDDLNGAAYILQFGIDSEDRSLIYNPEDYYLGGLYIQKQIADSLGIDPMEIRTQEQFYDLLVQIKNGGFKDDNGNDVYPLGPKYWGGSADTLQYIVSGYNWGVSDGYNITEDGTVLHEAETEYVYDKINFVRSLLADGLMNPEFFTMDSTRAEEVSLSHNSAIMADVHNYQEIIYGSEDWVPLGPLNDFTGDNSKIVRGKTGYGAFAISADAENPEEILKFFDYLSTEEGQLLCQYGVEGLSYNMVDGKPVLTDEVLQKITEGDNEYLVNYLGAGLDGAGCDFFFFVLTNKDNLGYFGESRPGANSSTTFARSIEIATDYPRNLKLVSGLSATAYLSADQMSAVNEKMALLDYNETLVQAIYATSDSEVESIITSFRNQLADAGIEEFKTYLKELYTEDSSSINFYTK